MTAPNVIWVLSGCPSCENPVSLVKPEWSSESQVRYIRDDAPEFVALVDALRFADETLRDLGWRGVWEVTSAALAAYKALK